MDFHSLKRRDLQALCKKNKIPANLTNVAMADALSALDTVEGMEEFLNQPSVESPEKAVKASPCVPRTGGRTTTRGKPIKEEAESVQISTRARRGTRKATVEGGTPRNQKEEVSVQKMHSRRSTRLLEKKMNELNLNEEDRIEAIDFGGSDEEMANEIGGNLKKHSDDLGEVVEDQGLNQETTSVDLLMKNDALEYLLDKKSDDLSESARELGQSSEVLNKSAVLVSEENAFELTPALGEDGDANKDQNEDNNGVDSEGSTESDILSGENLDKSQEVKDNATEKEGLYQGTKKSEDFLKTDDLEDLVDEKSDKLSKDARELEQPSEVPDESDQNAESDLLSGENLETCLDFKDDAPEKEAKYFVPEKGEQEDLGLEDSDDIFDPVDDLVSEDSRQVEVDTMNVSLSVGTADQKQDVELQNQAVIETDVFSAKDLEDEFDHTGQRNEESDLVIGSSIKIDSISIELSSAIECPPVMSSCSMICGSDVSDQVPPQDIAKVDNLMAVDPTKLSFPSDKTSDAELPVEMVSTLAADPLAEQMSLLQSNSDRVICSASATPRKKLSIKTPTTSRKISILLDENKENIDNSGRKLDLPKEKGKQEDPLNDKSLRQLSKLLREQLQITSKKNIPEEKDIAKVGRATRPALQSLPENRLAATEPEI